MLSEFIVWAGDMLAGEGGSSGGGGNTAGGDAAAGGNAPPRFGRRSGGAASMEEAARRYLRGGTAVSASAAEGDVEDVCSICQDGLTDPAACAELGESLTTECGHCFHASCYARLMETSEHDPVCPMCRTGNIAARFSGAA